MSFLTSAATKFMNGLLRFLCSITRHRGGVRLPGARRAAAVSDVSLHQFCQPFGHVRVPILYICPLANVGGEVVELNRRQTSRRFAPRPWRAPTAGVGAQFQFPCFLA